MLATLIYRASKAIENAPAQYSTCSVGAGARTPVEILHHISDLLVWTHGVICEEERIDSPLADWRTEVKRFYDSAVMLDKALVVPQETHALTWEQILQGPMCDAMTHVGQLLMLRRLAGAPVAGENFSRADIRVGGVQPE